ncbi:uncharacterized protein LOC123909814 isoform X1 [Trifolium pratense]|uniref:uncharacterized protein LOC123909814 isoform X1 n=1 Tax=Trifolium pratense TaxID=57577 RepID=UPI001E69180A|nr:uncharacterized protein LOC123909814 isoform X1 [Trifolium pratense]
MSMESDTSLFGVIRSPPENLEERGKRPKSESESEPKPELEPEPKSELEPEPKPKPERKPKPAWELKRVNDLTLSDFSMYDDDIKPFGFMCAKFYYRNKAQIQKDNEYEAAIADYKKRSRGLSVYDAITPPRIAQYGKCWVAVPLDLNENRLRRLIPLCKLALDKYNADNQGANFVFLDVVKTTWSAAGTYYITFRAEKDPPNCSATTFQAQVWENRNGPHKVKSCAIKTFAVPLDMDENLRSRLTPLCKLALEKYNADNQGANYVFLDVVKRTWSVSPMFYITFRAKKDLPNCSAKTFQAQVWENMNGPNEVRSCHLKKKKKKKRS